MAAIATREQSWTVLCTRWNSSYPCSYLCENSRLDLQRLCCWCLWYNRNGILHPYWEPRMLCSSLKSGCSEKEEAIIKLISLLFKCFFRLILANQIKMNRRHRHGYSLSHQGKGSPSHRGTEMVHLTLESGAPFVQQQPAPHGE